MKHEQVLPISLVHIVHVDAISEFQKPVLERIKPSIHIKL